MQAHALDRIFRELIGHDCDKLSVLFLPVVFTWASSQHSWNFRVSGVLGSVVDSHDVDKS